MDEKTLNFIAKAQIIHGDFYSYDKAVYLGNKEKLTITCPVHGDFEQVPSNHYKYNCSKCSIAEKNRLKVAKAASEYLAKVESIHGEKYDLAKIDYQGSSNKIIVVCFSHGEFAIAAKHFLSGSGCKKCATATSSLKTIEKAAQLFMTKARKKHGDIYGYDAVKYVGNTTKVKITCYTHGIFLQTPRKHLEGSGCHQCAIDNSKTRLSSDAFIERAKETHGDKYDYSETIFTKSHENLKIICSQHGGFIQNPHNHLAGAGCKQCADEALVKTEEEFVEQAVAKHKGIYTYDKVNYKSIHEKVIICCLDHGDFRQRPVLHLQGYGCSKCSVQKRAAESAHTTAQFILDANFVHDNRWSYDKTQYVNNNSKVTITCDIHGDFSQTAGSHKSGKGCPECGAKKAIEVRSSTLESFIERANIVHRNKYVYDLVDYRSTHQKVKIKCQIHGVFNQVPSGHLRGSGCPICANDTVSKKLSLSFDIFKMRAILVHEDKYQYALSGYRDTDNKVKIMCPEHGEFEQHFFSHLKGGQCPMCLQKKTRIQTDEFLVRAANIHFDRYNYEHVDCNGSNSIIDIECKQHGMFKQVVSQHLIGSGCRACYVDSTKLSIEQFLADCRLKHNNRYDYAKVSYNTIRDKIIVICREHGEFLQTAHDHKHGGGCPQCAEYFRNLDNKPPNTPCYLYYLTLKTESLIFYKIGITTKSVNKRFSALMKDNTEIVEQSSILTTLHNAIVAEQQILMEFANHKLVMSDTLKHTGGGSECFADDVLGIYDMMLEDYIQ
jgi:hypothetical protein